MLVLFGELDRLVEGNTRFGRLLGLQILVAAPAADPGNDQQRAGDDVDRILVPQLLELVATYFLVYFIKYFRHLKISQARWTQAKSVGQPGARSQVAGDILAIWRWQGKVSRINTL